MSSKGTSLPSAGTVEAAAPASVSPVAASASSTWLKFWGVRGSIATPGPTTVHYGGNTTCIEVRVGSQIIILDAGTGLRLLGRQLVAEFGSQPLDLTLLLTHTHWDHIQGLPFFQPVYKSQHRLHILGYEGARHGLEEVLASQMESPYFPIGLGEVPANVLIEELKELRFNVGSVPVQACYAYHPGVCVGYRLWTPGGSIAFLPDNELPPAELRDPPPAGSPEATAHVAAHGKHARLAEFLRGTDVLIMDAQYDCEEYKHHVGWGHGCTNAVVTLAIRAKVKQLFLFHHDPEHDDAKISAMVADARQFVAGQNSSLQVDAAREGVVVNLPV
jgi:phosphoribosyl 1,2-cyclic phosphodiesterase